MKLADVKRITGFIMVLATICTGIMAQEKNDAIKVFNEGVEYMKANDPRAIESFENCVTICEQIGDSAADIKSKAISVLPNLYYQNAFDLLAVDKKIAESIKASRISLKVAEKYGDSNAKESTEKLLIQAYSSMGSAFVASKENEKAIQAFDSVLMINPNHTASLFNKALIYKGLGDDSNFMKSIDLYIENVKLTGDSSKIEQANKIPRDYFRVAGGKANQANKVSDALDYLNTASKYGFDKNLYYQFASIYNKQKKYDLAAESAQNGLDLETGSAEAKAKFYYELGSALAGKGDTANACESFKNSMYGPFLQASKAQRTNMKCP